MSLQPHYRVVPTVEEPTKEQKEVAIILENKMATKQDLLDQADDHFRVSQDAVSRALLYHLKPLQRLFGTQQGQLEELNDKSCSVKEGQLDPIAVAQAAQRKTLQQLSLRLDALRERTPAA